MEFVTCKIKKKSSCQLTYTAFQSLYPALLCWCSNYENEDDMYENDEAGKIEDSDRENSPGDNVNVED